MSNHAYIESDTIVDYDISELIRQTESVSDNIVSVAPIVDVQSDPYLNSTVHAIDTTVLQENTLHNTDSSDVSTKNVKQSSDIVSDIFTPTKHEHKSFEKGGKKLGCRGRGRCQFVGP